MWYLYSENDPNCLGKDLDFLEQTLLHHCDFRWYSQQSRVRFYKDCLTNFPMNQLKVRKKKLIRRLQNFAYAIKRGMEKSGEIHKGGGGSMIAGSLSI